MIARASAPDTLRLSSGLRSSGCVAYVALLALALLICACGGGTVVVVTGEPTRGVERTSHPLAQGRFDAAALLYHDASFDEAVDAFRMFCAEFPQDILALRAEFYLGRSLVGAGRTLDARRIFRALYERPEDDDSYVLAALYLAFVDGIRGDRDPAGAELIALLDERGALSLPTELAVPGDESLLGSLLAEGLIQRGSYVAALDALEIVARSARDEALLIYAYDRAAELAEVRMSPRDLEEAYATERPFALAVVGAALAVHYATAGEDARAAAVLDFASTSMVDLGFHDRLQAARAVVGFAHGASDGRARYGLLVALTGPHRRAGRAALGAALLAQRAFEAEDGRTAMLIGDVGEGAEATREAVRQMAAQGVFVIIGPVESDRCEVARAEAASLGIAYIATTTEPLVTAHPLRARYQIDAAAEAQVVIQASAARYGPTRYVIVRESSTHETYLTRFADAADRELTHYGAEVTLTVYVDPDPQELQSSAREAARLAARSGADGLVLALTSEAAAAFVAYMAAENVWPRDSAEATSRGGRRLVAYVGSSFLPSENLMRDAADYLEGALLPVWFDSANATGIALTFRTRFVYTFGREPGTLEAVYFDVTQLVRSWLTDAGLRTPESIGTMFGSPRGFEGVLGRFSFDVMGNPAMSPAVLRVQDGAYVPYDG